MRTDIRIRIRSGIIHIQMESTSIRTITIITTGMSQTRSIHIRIIAFVTYPIELIHGLSPLFCIANKGENVLYSLAFDHITQRNGALIPHSFFVFIFCFWFIFFFLMYIYDHFIFWIFCFTSLSITIQFILNWFSFFLFNIDCNFHVFLFAWCKSLRQSWSGWPSQATERGASLTLR